MHICNKPLDQETPTIRFGDGGGSRKRSIKTPPGQIWSGCIRRIVLAYVPAGMSKAHTFVSLGSLPQTDDIQASLLLSERTADTLPIRFQSAQLAPSKSAVSSSTHRTSIVINVPLINIVLEKPIFDGLQIWADSVAQAIDQLITGTDEADTEVAHSRNPSLIGSRFFAKSRRVGSRGSEESNLGAKVSTPKQSETAVKVTIAEGRFGFSSLIFRLTYTRYAALIRVLISRSPASLPSIRPFDISASDIDALVELKPDGKVCGPIQTFSNAHFAAVNQDETVITSSLMDLHVGEVSPKWELIPLLVLTLPRSLVSHLHV